VRIPLALTLFLSTAPLAFSQQLEVPVIDLPYNAAHGLRGPSMQQSLGMTASVYEATHTSIQDAFGKRKRLGEIAVALFDLLPLPLTDVWIHEEWHRAILGRRGIDSFDDVYLFRATDVVAVSHVGDEDLVRLKRDHPADQVRLQEAGIEGEYALVQRLEKDRFFGDTRAWHLPLYWLVKLGASGYVQSGSWKSSDDDTDRSNAEDGANVQRRDFTGHDFIGWMYDLSRPDEPYETRGVHPSGVGINRYRKTTDLSADDRRFLHRQGQLQLLNLFDSNLIDIDHFKATIAGRPIAFNVTAAHLLTSFGYTIDANVFLRRGNHKLFVVLHDYKNNERNFPGAEVQWIDWPVTLRGRSVRLSPRIALWLQPEHQRFRDRGTAFGGLLALRADLPLERRYGAFIEVEGKTAGWAQGVEALERNLALRLGITFLFPKRR
jgi:hypothetical protein